MDRFVRYRQPFSVALLDVDKFKSVNDTYGHQVGDEVLIGLADILHNNLRKADVVGQLEDFNIPR